VSQSSTLITYAVVYTVTQTSNGQYDQAFFNLEIPGWTDAAVSAFIQGLEALPVPAGCTSQVVVNKTTQVSTNYTTSMGNPITFT
jgi:hypothetical protein